MTGITTQKPWQLFNTNQNCRTPTNSFHSKYHDATHTSGSAQIARRRETNV